MSLSNFLSYLQQILTMIDPEDNNSVALGKSALMTTIDFACASGKVDPKTLRVMKATEGAFYHLVKHSSEFAGKPGDLKENKMKRNRLLMLLYPHC